MKGIKKYELPILFFVSLITYYVQSIAWPFTLGRDGANYILYYLDILSNEPVYQVMMLMRTPVAPLLYGTLLSTGSVVLAEFVMGLLYSGAILGIYLIAKMWSNKLAIISALLVNFYPAYGAIYHTISSEAPLAFLFIVWCLYFLNTMRKPDTKRFIGLGIIAFLLIMTRPTLIAFILYAIVPLFLINLSTKEKIIRALPFVGTLLPLVLLWCTYNYVRYDDFTIARTNTAHLPLYRVFIVNHTVSPDNGKSSAKLADDVEKYLLNKEPYRSYGITKELFFSKSTSSMWSDLESLSDEIYGWDSDYRQLRQVGLEAVYRHPKEYLFSVIRSFAGIFLKTYTQPKSIRVSEIDNVQLSLDSEELPVPRVGDVIPRPYYWGLSSSPSGKMKPDPDSVELKILDPDMQKKADALNAKMQYYRNILPSRNGVQSVADVLNFISVCYLPSLLWLLLGVFELVSHPNMQNMTLAFICSICVLILFYTVLGVPSVVVMRVPFDPLFMLFGITGINEMILKINARKKTKIISGSL